MSMSLISCSNNHNQYVAELFETSAAGNKLASIALLDNSDKDSAVAITLHTNESYQTITGFGGSFTQSSAHLLNAISAANRQKIIEAYFGESGARYSLTRTHINSCDFSTGHYAYASIPGDTMLENFSLAPSKDDLIPMIKDAMATSKEGFRIIASPWTAPPWMKDNNDWRGGKLLPAYNSTWALYFSKYIKACKAEGIDIWGLTVENEPLGNDNNWESMHFSAEEMTAFVQDYLGPQLEKDGLSGIKILGYDQNRGEELKHWVDIMYPKNEKKNYYSGTAIHWYASTVDYFPDNLAYAHKAAPDKYLIQTEACVDADTPRWQQDDWYWSAEATDWGYDWAPEKDKHLHPKYVPVFRYARDIIGCLNNWVDGWVDWNMVLDRQGGPNWFKNWCVAPVIVDTTADEVYLTPLYYTMAHFSRYIRPGAKRIGLAMQDEDIQATAAVNPDGSIAVVLFNPTEQRKKINLSCNDQLTAFQLSPQSIQTLVLQKRN